MRARKTRLRFSHLGAYSGVTYAAVIGALLVTAIALHAAGSPSAARLAEVLLFSVLAITFLHNAIRPFAPSTEGKRIISALGAAAWATYAALLAFT